MNYSMTNIKEFISLGIKELEEKLKELKNTLRDFKLRNSSNQLKETHKIKDIRKDIARINTILTSRYKENLNINNTKKDENNKERSSD